MRRGLPRLRLPPDSALRMKDERLPHGAPLHALQQKTHQNETARKIRGGSWDRLTDYDFLKPLVTRSDAQMMSPSAHH